LSKGEKIIEENASLPIVLGQFCYRDILVSLLGSHDGTGEEGNLPYPRRNIW